VAHPFFGTAAVLDVLARLPGWAEGLVCLDGTVLQRDTHTGDVVGIVPDAMLSACA
jgi:hypothetical protein